MLKRICITGPESTGKSWLSKRLAQHYQTVWVPEYAVEYLEKRTPRYSYDDIAAIARGQFASEEQLAPKANKLLFCDSGLLVCKIWSEVVFNQTDPWINKMISKHPYDLYLLTSPDIPWQSGPFRENPDNRDELFELYENELRAAKFPYRIISGHGTKRLEKAVNIVDKLLKSVNEARGLETKN